MISEELWELRKAIDQIDVELVDIIAKWLQTMARISSNNRLDQSRVEYLRERIKENIPVLAMRHGLDKRAAQRIFKELIKIHLEESSSAEKLSCETSAPL